VRRVFLFVLLAAATNARAAEVIATIANDMLSARIVALDYPQPLQKQLTSGLTNRLYVRASLMDAQSVLARKSIEVSIRYDLWDEKFSVVTTLEGAPVETRVLSSLADVNAALSELALPRLFSTRGLPASKDLLLRVEVLLNPIDRERMRMVQKWVAQNSTPQIGGDVGTDVSSAVFNRIFEQYADGADIAAAWRTEVSSPPFRIDALRSGRAQLSD
jgi:hypothetical protein